MNQVLVSFSVSSVFSVFSVFISLSRPFLVFYLSLLFMSISVFLCLSLSFYVFLCLSQSFSSFLISFCRLVFIFFLFFHCLSLSSSLFFFHCLSLSSSLYFFLCPAVSSCLFLLSRSSSVFVSLSFCPPLFPCLSPTKFHWSVVAPHINSRV
jgi:hypothetical protein